MMDEAARAAFVALLEHERAEYARALPGRLAGMRRLWREIESGAAGPEDLARLARDAHGLAGSGAVFGFDALSTQARALELQLQVFRDAGAAAARAPPDAIGASIERLQDLAGKSG